MTCSCIVIHEDPDDGVANALAGVPGVRLLHLDELASDWVIEEASPVDVSAMTLQTFGITGSTYVINRVFSFDHSRTGRRLADCGLHPNWGHLALRETFRGVRLLAHGIGGRGVSRCLLPLNVQWKLISEISIILRCPEFAFGFGHRLPDMTALKNAMQKSVWSYFNWGGTADVAPGEAQWHPFFVERPPGVPVVCSYHGSAVHLAFPRGPVFIDDGLVCNLVAACRAVFDSTLGEFLLYQSEGEPPIFCAFSPYMSDAATSSGQRKMLLQGLGQFAVLPAAVSEDDAR